MRFLMKRERLSPLSELINGRTDTRQKK